MNWINVSMWRPDLDKYQGNDILHLPTSERELDRYLKEYPDAEIEDVTCWNHDVFPALSALLPEAPGEMPYYRGIVQVLSDDCTLHELNRFLQAVVEMPEEEAVELCKQLKAEQERTGEITTTEQMLRAVGLESDGPRMV